jgi:cobalt-precorrin 5A hydrolase
MAVEGDFSSSDFVMETTGADNVCERAVAAAGGRIIVRKAAKYGITVAIGKKDAG